MATQLTVLHRDLERQLESLNRVMEKENSIYRIELHKSGSKYILGKSMDGKWVYPLTSGLSASEMYSTLSAFWDVLFMTRVKVKKEVE